jgi:hypothetical protein
VALFDLFTELLGEVAAPPWLQLRLSTERHPSRFSTALHLTVQVERHVSLLPNPLTRRSPIGPEPTPTFTRGPQSFSIPLQASDGLREFHERLDFMQRARQQLLDEAYLLYEFDPRVGWSFDGDGVLPSCPLLDPKPAFSRTGLFEEDARRLGKLPPRSMRSRCPFCRDGHFDPPIWGGGNLLWVHPVCWRNVWS